MSCSRRLSALSMLLVVAACDAPTIPSEAPGYEPRLGSGQIFHWPLGRAIRVYVDPTDGGAVLADEVRYARGAWRDVVYYREFDITLVATPTAADVIVHTRPAPFLVTFPSGCGSPTGLGGGETFFCADDTGNAVAVLPLVAGGGGHVKMDVSIDLGSATPPYSVRSLLTHEIGHVLGIGRHSVNASDLMYAAPVVTKPSDDDASTLRYLLHQPAALRL